MLSKRERESDTHLLKTFSAAPPKEVDIQSYISHANTSQTHYSRMPMMFRILILNKRSTLSYLLNTKMNTNYQTE